MAKKTAKPKTVARSLLRILSGSTRGVARAPADVSRKTKTVKSRKHLAGVKYEDITVVPERKSAAKPNAG